MLKAELKLVNSISDCPKKRLISLPTKTQKTNDLETQRTNVETAVENGWNQ